MNRSLRGKKNKNAVAQFNPPQADLAPTDQSKANNDAAGVATLADRNLSSRDLNKGTDGRAVERRDPSVNSGRWSPMFTDAGPHAGNTPNREGLIDDAVWQDFTEVASAVGREREKKAQEQNEGIDLSNYPWPGSEEDKAEKTAFRVQYQAANKMDVARQPDTTATSASKRGKPDGGTWSSTKGQGDLFVDQPMGAWQGDQGGQWKPFGNEGVTTPVKPVRSKNAVAGSATTSTVKAESSSNKSVASTAKPKPKPSGLPSRYQETNAALADLVLQDGLIVKDVYPDGNCLFAAVVDQLRVRGEFFYTTKSLRDVAVNYLRENPCQEDGTPLHLFLTEHDGTWDQYLTRMGREGEWGDHFVISALASVLKRRLIILRGFEKLTRTVMEPRKSTHNPDPRTSADRVANETENPSKPVSPISKEPEARQDDDGKRDGPEKALKDDGKGKGEENMDGSGEGSQEWADDLYIGHIAEAHYVSLRSYDWEDKFHQSLKERRVPSFLKYSPDVDTEKDTRQTGDGGDPSTSAFPMVHLDFFLKYIRQGDLIMTMPWSCRMQTKSNDIVEQLTLGDVECGLEAGSIFGATAGRLKGKRRHGTAASKGDGENSLWDQLVLDMYRIPLDTKVMTGEELDVSASKKDLISWETGCPAGYTRLIPVSSPIWLKAIEECDEVTVLKQLHLPGDTMRDGDSALTSSLAFKCSWPSCSDFLSRKRFYEWPDTDRLRRMKKRGVHVIPQASKDSTNPNTEWKFSFKHTEKFLCVWMSQAMKYGYHFFKIVCQTLFQDEQYKFQHKDAVCREQLKAVFFYACEQLPSTNFEEQPGLCLHHMLQRLQGHLEKGFLPDYFIPEINLVAGVDEDVLLWHAKQIDWFQTHILEGIFLLLDKNELMNLFSLGRCIETLISDAQKFVLHQNMIQSYRECFLPVNILGIQNWVRTQRFDKAKELCDKAFEECTTYMESMDASEEILQKAMEGLPLVEKWLFAFYMDMMLGSHLLVFACSDHQCAQLEEVFGEASVSTVAHKWKMTRDSLRVPVTIIYSESIVPFAESFTKILHEQDDRRAFKEATHFFLKTKSRELILNIAIEAKEGNYHTGHNDTKMKLHSLFSYLYEEYDYDKQWQNFFDVMEEYDLLSVHYQNARLNQHVATMWEYYKYPDKCADAFARYQSLVGD